MFLAEKWFCSFNGFKVVLSASNDLNRSWRAFCDVQGMTFERQDDCCSGLTKVNYAGSEAFLWVKVPEAWDRSCWTPAELAAHELVHMLAALGRWIGEPDIAHWNEPAAYTFASCLHMYAGLVAYEQGQSSLSDLQSTARDVDFRLTEVPGLAIQPYEV